ncbi:hypothetical protein FRC01_009857, partial [Tulasnella sp. 417]
MNLELLTLKSQRNLHAPIHKLPTELLIYIFRLSLPAPETGPSYIQVLGTLFSVCTHWATMINAATSLWAVVTTMCGPSVLESSLAKLDSNCPLHIDCASSSDEEFTHLLRKISPHIHRWETADIVMPQTEEGSRYLSVPAPRLRRLHLQAPRGTAANEVNSRALDIFNGSADRLEEVKVTWTCLPWDSPILQGLKSLNLHCCGSIRVSSFIAILKNCPDLATLVICGVDIVEDMEADPSKAVSMTRLANIEVAVEDLEGIGEVMSGFNAPNCKSFKFEYGTLELGGIEDFILNTLSPHFPLFRRAMFEHPKAVINISNRRVFHIQCPLETHEEEQSVGFNLYFSEAPPDIAMAFLRQVLEEGGDGSCKPDVRLIIGRDWGTEGISILDE